VLPRCSRVADMLDAHMLGKALRYKPLDSKKP
jgi:hypothetical protein